MKYNANLDLYHDNTLAKMLKQIEPKSVILEFGPANGRMTKYMKEELNCKVYAVEIDEQAAKDCLPYVEEIIVDDIEKYKWAEKFQAIKFDYIIFADVLEHLYDPKMVLERSMSLLRVKGTILISVPNIAHNSLLINLWNNRFEYTNIGLLDNTHVHFFSYYSLIELFYDLDLVPILEDACYSEVGDNEIKATYKDFNPIVETALRKREYGNVYQYIFQLRKKDSIDEEGLKVWKKIKPNFSLPYFFQVYFDQGQGFIESDSYLQSLNYSDQQNIKIDLSHLENLQQIRIDPANIPVMFFCQQLVINYIDGTSKKISLNDLDSNADSILTDWFIFNTNDSQIIMSDKKYFIKAKELIMDFIVLDFRPIQKYFDLNSPFFKELHCLKKRISLLDDKYTILEEEKNRLKKQNSDLQLENINLQKVIENLNNSWTKKIERFLFKKFKGGN